MDDNKKSTTIWLRPSVISRMDGWLEADNCQSRSEFVDKALRFYMGYWETITSQQNASVAVFNSTHGTTPDLFGSVRVSTASECHTAGTYTGTIYFIIEVYDF